MHKETATGLTAFPKDGSGPALTYAGGSYDNGDTTWDFEGYAFMDTRAWVNVQDTVLEYVLSRKQTTATISSVVQVPRWSHMKKYR